ncbi:MAG: diacylglycerol kinase family protein [Pirellulaceae bacterium]|jgi:diacylglycerol kinase|nr:diacylglycerol kinase family protein [Pirellulaceae bacterium]MDP7015671.1 diacylglycerol kinase family protein [Pirellulaceae bacterium]
MPYARSPRSWIRKFVDAFRGIGLGVRGQNSFLVHLPAAVVVAAAAAALRVERWEWVAVILSITAVWAAELFNSSLERLCLAVDREFNEDIGAALDIASGAVLIVSIGAATVGCLVLGHAAWRVLL